MYKINNKYLVIIGIIIVVIAVGIFIAIQKKAVEVNGAVVVKGDIKEYVEELGVVMAENSENIYAPTAGKVTEVLVGVGDSVEKGDVLVRLDHEQVSRQIMELEAQRSVIIAQYNEALEPIDTREIEKLELQLATQEQNLAEAQRKKDNSEILYEAGAISKEEYQGIVINLEAERASLESIKLDLELLKKPVSTNVISQFEGQLKQLDIQMEELRSTAEDFNIIAPIKGMVMMKDIEVGSYLQPGMHILEIGDKEELYIESDVLVEEIRNIEIGSDVEIFNKDLEIEEVKGKVRKIHPKAFSKVSDLGIEQKRIKVEIVMEDRVEALRPGYDLDIKIIIDSKENVLLVPESAVFEENGKDYVFVNESNTAVLREIKKGMESQKLIEVVSGLKEGEEVILSPDGDLSEGIGIKKINHM